MTEPNRAWGNGRDGDHNGRGLALLGAHARPSLASRRRLVGQRKQRHRARSRRPEKGSPSPVPTAGASASTRRASKHEPKGRIAATMLLLRASSRPCALNLSTTGVIPPETRQRSPSATTSTTRECRDLLRPHPSAAKSLGRSPVGWPQMPSHVVWHRQGSRACANRSA